MRFIITTLLLIAGLGLKAQLTTISFDHSTHAFGEIKEVDGPVKHVFNFKNSGNVPLFISDVKASCGCTIPSWTKDTIAPGASGFIEAKFNPENRPGPFNKTLTVVANTDPSITILTFTGIVIPRPAAVASPYVFQSGNLGFESEYLNFGGVSTKEAVSKEMKIVNNGKSAITLSATALPSHIKVTFTPASIEAGGTSVMKVTYDPKAKNDFGYVNDKITIKTNDAVTPEKTIYVVANISEYFAPVSAEELMKAPRSSWAKTEHDFGVVKAGTKTTFEYSFVNTGQQDLHIRKIKPGCFCLSGTPSKAVVKPGETASISVTFDATNMTGKQNKFVTVYVNDPSNPAITLFVKGSVTE